MADVAGPWWVAVAAAVPSVASGTWVVWRWWADRGDKKVVETLTYQERVQRDLDTQRTAMSADQQRMVDALRVELSRFQVRNAELERDRDRGWDLARWWNRRAHEMRHAATNAQSAASNLAASQRLEAPTWPDMTLPGLETPE